MKKSFLFRILVIFLVTLFLIGESEGKKKKIKVKEQSQDLENDSTPPGHPGPPSGFRYPPRPRPKLDPYRCDHLVDFKQPEIILLEKADTDFIACCRSFPKGTFGCPQLAPPGHVCGLPNPPNCCTCPPIPLLPVTTPKPTTTTTTEEPQEDEDEEDEEEEEEEEEEK